MRKVNPNRTRVTLHTVHVKSMLTAYLVLTVATNEMHRSVVSYLH